MARSTFGRGARLTSLALATGTLVVASIGSAQAAPVEIPKVFGGATNAASISIDINLPVEVPGIGSSIHQDISLASGNTAQGAASPVSVATGRLGSDISNIPLVSEKLSDVLSVASLAGKRVDANKLLELDPGSLIKLGLGTSHAQVSPEAAATTLTSSSDATLASLKISLGSILGKVPAADLKAPLDDALDTAASTVTSTTGTVTQTLNGVLAQLDQQSQGATAPVSAQIKTVEKTVTNLLDNLQAILGNLNADTNLVSLATIGADQTVTRNGSTVKATADSLIKDLDILGLVKVDLLHSTAVASATGKAGGAAASATTVPGHVKVGDVLDVFLNGDGSLGGTIGGVDIKPVGDATKTVFDTLNNTLLPALGVQIGPLKNDSPVIDPKGLAASAATNGWGIIVNPLKAAKPLVAIRLVPAAASVNAAVVPNITPVCTTGPCSPDKPTKNHTVTHFAHTGANLPLTGGLATILVLMGLAARRRFASEV